MMYSCGHDSQGERNLEYEKLLPHQRMSMSSGQCPNCVALRNRHQIADLPARGEFKLGTLSVRELIPPDPEILKIARLFLEKYEILSDEDRRAYRGFISCLINPPLAFNMETK
jgi:hypothetical protein